METLSHETAVTVGNFDGVHRGHRKLIARVQELAKKLSLSSLVLTFDPHPAKVLAPDVGVKSLFDLKDRLQIFKELGVDHSFVLPFNRDLSVLEPEDFFKKILIEKLKMKALCVGPDFSFGHKRAGTQKTLQLLCQKYDVTLDIVQPLKMAGVVVSSSQIRKSLAEGNVELAREFLARPYYLKGVVEKGAGRGKKIGVPTANLFTKAELFPQKGVYITTTQVRGEIFKSVTNIGVNPTFAEDKKKNSLSVETHILNFDEDIYGEEITVYFYKFLREEKKFSSVDELVKQIKSDIKKAEGYVSK